MLNKISVSGYHGPTSGAAVGHDVPDRVPDQGAEFGAWPMQHPIEASLAWSALILAVAAPLASRYFRRRTTE